MKERAAVQQVISWRLRPLLPHLKRKSRGEQRANAVDDCRVNYLAATGPLAFVERREHADQQVERPASIVAEKVDRRDRYTVAPANRIRCASDRQIVDIVPRHLRGR